MYIGHKIKSWIDNLARYKLYTNKLLLNLSYRIKYYLDKLLVRSSDIVPLTKYIYGIKDNMARAQNSSYSVAKP